MRFSGNRSRRERKEKEMEDVRERRMKSKGENGERIRMAKGRELGREVKGN